MVAREHRETPRCKQRDAAPGLGSHLPGGRHHKAAPQSGQSRSAAGEKRVVAAAEAKGSARRQGPKTGAATLNVDLHNRWPTSGAAPGPPMLPARVAREGGRA